MLNVGIGTMLNVFESIVVIKIQDGCASMVNAENEYTSNNTGIGSDICFIALKNILSVLKYNTVEFIKKFTFTNTCFLNICVFASIY
jgi:hypothetical protein